MILLAIQLSSALAGTTTTIDFEAVTIEGEHVGPSIGLVTDSTRDLCPDSEGIDSPGWTECVVNLSYTDIKRLCGSLGPEAIPMVQALLHSPTRHDGFDRDLPDQTMRWRGCFYNSRSGARVETFVWRGTGSGWIVTDESATYGQASTQASLSAFDSYARAQPANTRGAIELPATLAYHLRPMSSPGTWTAVPSTTNQDEINALLAQLGVHEAYCGTKDPHRQAETDCTVLPRLAVVAVSPTMMAVQSYSAKRLGYLVSGIFWRSETGFDITQVTE